jgi:hypothetical protein
MTFLCATVYFPRKSDKGQEEGSALENRVRRRGQPLKSQEEGSALENRNLPQNLPDAAL